MNSTITREKAALTLFPMEEKEPSCPVCGSRYLFDDAESGLFSCRRCSSWLRRGPVGIVIPTSVPTVDTNKLALPWRKATT